MFKNLRNEPYEKYLKIYNNGSRRIKYLPWETCWNKLKEEYPSAKYEWIMYTYDGKPYAGIMAPDGSVTVHCKITIEFKGKEYIHNEYMTVKSKTNRNPIQNPASGQMEYTFRKALGRGIAMMTGFGIKYWIE